MRDVNEEGVCECEPGAPPIPCGTDAGICDRGLRFCGTDGFYGACVLADLGAACDTDDDCADDPEDDGFMKALHLVLLDVHLEEGALICPE